MSGAAGWGTAHRVLAAVALPPLAALVATAWVSARRLLPLALTALVLFGLAALADGTRRASRRSPRSRSPRPRSLAAATFRGSTAQGPLRDYVTLTKPRIMSLLLLTGAAGVFVGAGGVPSAGAFAADDGRPRARVRGRLCAEPLPRSRHRQVMGVAHRAAPGRLGSRSGRAGPRVRPRALGILVRAARLARQPADRPARARGQSLLRARLHALAEALDGPEHRHRRRSRSRAAARRLRRRYRPSRLGRPRDVRRRLRVDAAALLGAGTDDQGALREGGCADAARDARRSRDCPSDRALHRGPDRRDARPGRLRGLRPRVRHRRCSCSERCSRGTRSSFAARCSGPPRSGSSTTPSSTSRCSSSRWQSTRWSR